jgi:hypothetical protein
MRHAAYKLEIHALVYSAPIEENEETPYQRIFDACLTAAGPLKGCDSPRSDVSKRPLIQMQNILSTCCELWLDKR